MMRDMRLIWILTGMLLLFGGAARAETVPATLFFPVLPEDAPPDTRPQFVPIAAKIPANKVNYGIDRAIVVIHDETRDAPAAFALLSALGGAQNASTVIIAPQFLIQTDLMRFIDYLPDKGKDFASWPIVGWISGDDSVPVSGRRNISSFTVVDMLLMYLSDRTIFPDMKTIVIAGHGAGANFVQRYAAFSKAHDLVTRAFIDVRYLVAGAKSYLYQTPSRATGKRSFGLPDKAACPEYNAYPYGMEKLNAYARRRGMNAAKIDYGIRFITYINANASGAPLDTECSTLAQGATSAVRAENYHRYLKSVYGDLSERTQRFVKVLGPAYDALALFGSPCGMAVLFGDGMCASGGMGTE
ncbi:MAG: hypothetical protein PHW76_05285 [Alphaproteobacteria bacterium]|nr:hypothetical protein [Alphaproteobacteria bacterium]